MATTPLVVIVGPTASGKTGVAIAVAKQIGGEIICADSRTIYKGMDIGTAKPTHKEQQGVPHWGLDIVAPDESFSVADFQAYALQKIDEIRTRGNVPILVGGTGLYIDAIVFNYQFGPPVDYGKRQVFEAMSLQELHEYCKKNNVLLPENDKNKRYVIRAIEQYGYTPERRLTPIEGTIIVGITTNRDVLRQKIADRVETMFQYGVIDEAIGLAGKYGWDNQAMTSNVYATIHYYVEKKMNLDEVKEKTATLDWRLAKRQLTWLKRNSFIHWFPLEQVNTYIVDSLAKQNEA